MLLFDRVVRWLKIPVPEFGKVAHWVVVVIAIGDRILHVIARAVVPDFIVVTVRYAQRIRSTDRANHVRGVTFATAVMTNLRFHRKFLSD
jgi:hypothetical protein